MDYFYQDQIRWNLGFDNPNHAAAFIAALLPFLWLLGRLGKSDRPIFRMACQIPAGAMLLAGWGLLGLTISRSGLVAAVLAFAWSGFYTFSSWKDFFVRRGMWVLACAALLAATGIATRTATTAFDPDASATNRLVLWKGGLEMLAIAPQGVGAGNSGAFYMNWLQPLESQAGYRTMVNSYLTFLTEYGVWAGMLTGFLALAVVLVCLPDLRGASRARDAVTACHASLMAFATAGFFSTTMETAWVWLPALFSLLLLGYSTYRYGRTTRMGIGAALALAAILAAGIVAGLWSSGWILRINQPVQMHYDGPALLLQNGLNGSDLRREIYVQPNEAIMGGTYGKGIRRLFHGIPLSIRVCQSDIPSSEAAEWGVVTGRRGESFPAARSLMLLAPEILSEEETRALLSSYESLVIILPGFDEDGRVAYWRETAANNFGKIQIFSLPEFGNDFSQAWPIIAEYFRKILEK